MLIDIPILTWLLDHYITDIIKGMTKKSMNVEAVDIVYAFGLEDSFSPQEILLSFLQECDETWKRKINEVRGSTMQLVCLPQPSTVSHDIPI